MHGFNVKVFLLSELLASETIKKSGPLLKIVGFAAFLRGHFFVWHIEDGRVYRLAVELDLAQVFQVNPRSARWAGWPSV